MNQTFKIGGSIALAGALVGTAWYGVERLQRTHRVLPKIAMEKPGAASKRIESVHQSPKDFIAKNESSPDKQVQSLVTRARIIQAYDSAKKKDFSAARAEFVEAAYKHKGTDAMDPDFGTLSEQAAYQAIVCLDAEGKKDEARKEYRKFMTDRPLSPLITACFRRLERLNGKNLPEDEARLQSGIAAQEKRIRFETSVCGPKCLEKVLPIVGGPTKDYKELAKLCGTTDQGTTMEGLKNGCETLGLHPTGLDLNAADFNHLEKPFIWLMGDHYLAVLEKSNGRMRLFDPRYGVEEWKPLPKDSDASFRAIGLAFDLPTSNLVIEPPKGATTIAGGKKS